MRTADAITTGLFIIACIVLLVIPTGFENRIPDGSFLVKAKVLEVNNSAVEQYQIVTTGSQYLEVEILEGEFAGTTTQAINQLTGRMEFDEVIRPYSIIMIEYKLNDDHDIEIAYSRGYYRLQYELLLILLFAGFLIAVAGWTGLKAIVSFAFAALMIWKILIPLFLKGVDPIPLSLAVVALLTASISFLVGGLTRKGLTAFAGSFSGLLLTCILAKLFAPGFVIHGAVKPFAETLLYSGYEHLNLSGIFLAGIFIACSGAVMDLAMDVSASIYEIKQKKPEITFWPLFKSGMAVGRSVIGTMTTTLLLAYSGGYTAMMMCFMAKGLPVAQILNKTYVAAEILNIIVGSFGLVAVAPLTALIGSMLMNMGNCGDDSESTK